MICLTASVPPEEQIVARAAGVNAFLHKTVELASLLELLAAYVLR